MYEPAIVNGKPIPLSFTVTVQFTLDGKKGAAAGVSGGVVGGVLGGVVGGVMTTEEAQKLAAEGERLGPVRAVGNIQPPRLIRQVDPVYPNDARAAGVEGIVIIEAETDVYGRVKTPKSCAPSLRSTRRRSTPSSSGFTSRSCSTASRAASFSPSRSGLL